MSRGGGHTAHLTHRPIRGSERVEFECGATGWPVPIDPRDQLRACTVCVRGANDPGMLDAIAADREVVVHG